MGAGPIFIGGLSFSGKTILRLRLDAHPNIVITRRVATWHRFYHRYRDLGRPEQFERCLTAMLRDKNVARLEPDVDRVRREFRQGPQTYARLVGLLHEQWAERLGKGRWGNQLGLIERYADQIFTAYPAARVIHMIRDPRDRLRAALSPEQPHQGRVGWDMARWLHSVRLARRNQQHYPERYMVVRYEALVARPEHTLREVCAFVGEEFVPAMLAPEDRPVAPARWLRRREVAFAQSYSRREMLAHGYAPEELRLAPGERLLYSLVDWPANLAGALAWRALEATPLARH